ncbi:leucine-rich repeat neuronal protein 2-like isoform X2 [Belonocnema kinseyi]|uniref:leucine-rich repeat neuronal protein 2-like isoform X2 n=1 Tax=Belonocnema kinseyi TaxID=2817044 RepID=UPI00143D53C8|nr:leucine-rich repeat neuronal protein 2-like isoform X2 [Belonocnema kinseyi]
MESFEFIVDLSNKNLENVDFFKTYQHDIEVHTVRELNLSGNSLNSFLDCATSLNNLEVLDLSRNRLDRFFFLCRNESYDLRFLNVSHNKLEYIDENALNHRTGKLKVLDISWNLLSGINDTVLQHMKVLEFVSFASNPIGDNIEELVFENLTTLTHLDLKNISATFISPKLFENLINLEYLDLSLNPIEAIPSLPYDKLEVLDLSQTNLVNLGNLKLPNLRELKLNNMPNLTIVILSDFEKLPNLEVLSMKECKRLTQLRIRPQNPNLLFHLRFLYIQNCAIETLSSELQSIIQRTAVFEFQNNPWHCDCRMKWITVVNTTHNLSNTTKCNSPASVHNKVFSEIPPTELQCQVEGYSFSPILWVCVTSASLGLVVVGSILMFKESLTHWIIRRRRISGDSVSYTNVIESSNDLVKILTESDVQDRFDECIKP